MAWQTKLIAGEGETIPMKKFINLMSGMTRMFAMMTLLAAATQAQTSRAATASSYLERGNVWVGKGAFDRAIDDFGLAIAFDPGQAGAWYNRAAARYLKGDLDGALADFNRDRKSTRLNSSHLGI